MIKLIKCLFMVLLVCGGIVGAMSYSGNHDMNDDLSEEGKMLYGFIAREGKHIEEKYNMSQCCIGGGADNGIWLMTLHFNRYGSLLTEQEARNLIIRCLHDFLDAVNKDEKLRPFLKNYPFEPKNVGMAIFSYTSDRKNTFHPYIRVVSATKGRISYYTKEESKEFGYKSEKDETYEKAIAILQQEKL